MANLVATEVRRFEDKWQCFKGSGCPHTTDTTKYQEVSNIRGLSVGQTVKMRLMPGYAFESDLENDFTIRQMFLDGNDPERDWACIMSNKTRKGEHVFVKDLKPHG